MTLKNKYNSKSGFSLMEFLVVVGILAVLAAIAVPITLGVINTSNNKNDEVLAATYTEYMQKFATEKAGSAEYYTTLSNDGSGSEYEFLKQNSGTGAFPGITQLNENINNASTENDVWNLIRKEACIAIKAYGGKDLADETNYLVAQPHNDDKAFVYYYLTGKVALVNKDELEGIDQDAVKDGAVDTEDYWIYLDRTGGSGKATADNSSQRDFYVQIYQYGVTPNTPMNGVNVSIKLANGATKSATTTDKGMIVFRNVKENFSIFADGKAMISYPNSSYYPSPEYRNNFVNINTETIGNSVTNPFVIYIKAGSKGTVGLYETVITHNKVIGGEDKTTVIQQPVANGQDFNASFTAIPTNTSKNTSYKVTTPSHIFELFPSKDTPNFPNLLMFGNYDLKIDGNSTFETYTDKITSIPNGIYTTSNPGDAPDKKIPFEYQVVLERKQTVVKGEVFEEILQQPLSGTVLCKTTVRNDEEVSSVKNFEISAKVIAVDKDGNIIGSAELKGEDAIEEETFNARRFPYTLVITAPKDKCKDFNLYIEVFYGEDNKLYLKDFPEKINNDGATHIIQANNNKIPQVDLQSDVATVNPSVSVIERNDNYADGKKDVGEIKVTLDREGYSSNTSLTHYEKTGSNGKVNFTNVKKGFYDIKIEFLSRTDLPDIIDEVVVDDDGDFVFEYKTKPQREITYTIKCQPIYGDGTFRTFSNVRNVVGPGPKDIYTPIKFTIYVNGKKYLGEQLISYHKADGYVTVTFKDSSICKSEDEDTPSLLVKQEVECFNKEDCYEYYKAIVSDFTNSVENFQIRRCEELSTSTNDHLEINGWEWKADESAKKHYQQCKKCDFTRFRTNHFKIMNSNGKTVAQTPEYYANNAYIGNDKSVSTSHDKFCTVCRKYNETETCTNSSWTEVYNKYVKDSARADKKVLLTSNAIGNQKKSDTNHYKYCTVCYQRTVAAEHDKQWKVTKEHEKFDKSNHKDDLTGKFNYKDMGKQKFPDGTEKQSHAKFCKTCNYQYGNVKAHNSNTTVVKYADRDGKEYTTKVNSAVKKITYKYCSGCGHCNDIIEEDLVRECTGNHVWKASCGVVHEKSFPDAWACEHTTSAHCWTCGSSSGCCNVKYRCVTCINCGILNLHGDPNPKTRNDMWCYAHEKGYKTVKYNEALNKKYGKLHNTNSENKY